MLFQEGEIARDPRSNFGRTKKAPDLGAFEGDIELFKAG